MISFKIREQPDKRDPPGIVRQPDYIIKFLIFFNPEWLFHSTYRKNDVTEKQLITNFKTLDLLM